MGIFALLLAFVTCLLPAPAAGSPSLSDDQRRLLDGGEVVVLPVLPPGKDPRGSQGGTALSVVRAPASAVWQVLIDYQRHRGLYPNVVEAEVLESTASRALVRYVVGIGPFMFGFHVNNYPDAAHHRLVWRLAEGRRNGLFRDSWGYWEVDPDARGAIVTYAMAARTMLPAFLTRASERDGLVETVRAVRQRAERVQ